MSAVPNFLSKLPTDIQLAVHQYTPFPIQSDDFRDILIEPIVKLWKKILSYHPMTRKILFDCLGIIIIKEPFRSLRAKTINYLFNSIFYLNPTDLDYIVNYRKDNLDIPNEVLSHLYSHLNISISSHMSLFSHMPVPLFWKLHQILGTLKLVRINICQQMLILPNIQKFLKSKALSDDLLLELYVKTNSKLIFRSSPEFRFIPKRVFSAMNNFLLSKHVKEITLVDFFIKESDVTKLLTLRKVVDITMCTSRSFDSKESISAFALIIFIVIAFVKYSPIMELGFCHDTLNKMEFMKVMQLGIVVYIFKIISDRYLNYEHHGQIIEWQEQFNKQQEQLNKEVDQKNLLA
jgi:hypothetical protein